MFVAYNAYSYASFDLFLSLFSHKNNAYRLARAICRYREYFGESNAHYAQMLAFIKTPQNRCPYESVELAADLINSQRQRLDNNQEIRLFEYASKACCWGVAAQYRQAIESLRRAHCYNTDRGLYILSLKPDEMLQSARQLIDGAQYRRPSQNTIGRELPAEKIPHHFRALLNRICDGLFDNSKIAVDMTKILYFFERHPEHLSWANEIASQALEGCVNQPLMGWLEICAWVHIAKQTTTVKKLEAANFLKALAHIKWVVGNGSFFIPTILYPEFVCGMMQTLYYRLCAENVVTDPWIGIFDGLWNRYIPEILLSPYCAFNRDKAFYEVRNMSIDDAFETVFMQSAGKEFWAKIAITENVRRAFSLEHDKEKSYLRHAVLYLSGGDFADACSDIGEMGYDVGEFEVFLESKVPNHRNKNFEQKIAAVDPLNKELQILEQHQEISFNQKALIWTKAQLDYPVNLNPGVVPGPRRGL